MAGGAAWQRFMYPECRVKVEGMHRLALCVSGRDSSWPVARVPLLLLCNRRRHHGLSLLTHFPLFAIVC